MDDCQKQKKHHVRALFEKKMDSGDTAKQAVISIAVETGLTVDIVVKRINQGQNVLICKACFEAYERFQAYGYNTCSACRKTPIRTRRETHQFVALKNRNFLAGNALRLYAGELGTEMSVEEFNEALVDVYAQSVDGESISHIGGND